MKKKILCVSVMLSIVMTSLTYNSIKVKADENPLAIGELAEEENAKQTEFLTTDMPDSVTINDNNFPDEVFRNYVRQYDMDNDGRLSLRERYFRDFISPEGVSDYKGLEYFIISSFTCRNCKARTLDLRANTSIKTISISDSPDLKYLDVRECLRLEALEALNTSIEELNIAANEKLSRLDLSGSKIKKYDISNNTCLEEFRCANGHLERLEMSGAANLKRLDCSGNRLGRLELKDCNKLNYIDCSNNRIKWLDLAKQSKLAILRCDNNRIEQLDVTSTCYGSDNSEVLCGKQELSSGAQISLFLTDSQKEYFCDKDSNKAQNEKVCLNTEKNSDDFSENGYQVDFVHKEEGGCGIDGHYEYWKVSKKGETTRFFENTLLTYEIRDINKWLATEGKIPMTSQHQWDKGNVIVEATDHEPGMKVYTCTNCRATKCESIPAKKKPEEKEPIKFKTGEKFVDSKTRGTYVITGVGRNKATVSFLGSSDPKAASIIIPNTVKYKTEEFQVTQIGDKALKSNKRITKLSIGKNVKKIGKQAFAYCSKLKNIYINTRLLSPKMVGADAFKGLGKKCRAIVPKGKYKSYRSLLKDRGFKGIVSAK